MRPQTRKLMRLSLWLKKKAPHTGRRAGKTVQGCVLALTGKASDAVHQITSGHHCIPINGSNSCVCRLGYQYLAKAYADLRQFDDAWRCIDEAIAAVERTKERWWEAEVNRIAGEIALKSPEPDTAKAEAYFERALAVARQTAGQSHGNYAQQ